MHSKTFEIRDSAVLIPVLAVRLAPANEADRWLLAWSGYGQLPEKQANYVLLAKLYGGRGPSTCDPADWGCKTMDLAHRFIIDHFDALESGAVVDLEFIRGETKQPKASEALSDQPYSRAQQRKFAPSESTMAGLVAENRQQRIG